MKKSASGAPVTRIRPSAPTPLCRSQIASISEASRESRPSTSSMRTKSLPVPLYFATLSSTILEGPQNLVDERAGASFARMEPPDPRITPEPRQLTPREATRTPHDPRSRLVQSDPPRHVLDGLSVPD